MTTAFRPGLRWERGRGLRRRCRRLGGLGSRLLGGLGLGPCFSSQTRLPGGLLANYAGYPLLWALPALVAKLAAGGLALATIETILAKLRIFRVPEFLATAFLLGVLALLVHLLLGA